MTANDEIRICPIPAKRAARWESYHFNRQLIGGWYESMGGPMTFTGKYSSELRGKCDMACNKLRKDYGARLPVSDHFALIPTMQSSIRRSEAEKYMSDGDLYRLFNRVNSLELEVTYKVGFMLVARDPRNYMALAGYTDSDSIQFLSEQTAIVHGERLWLKPTMNMDDLDVPIGLVTSLSYVDPSLTMVVEGFNGEDMKLTLTK